MLDFQHTQHHSDYIDSLVFIIFAVVQITFHFLDKGLNSAQANRNSHHTFHTFCKQI